MTQSNSRGNQAGRGSSQAGESEPPALTTAGSAKTGARCSSQSGSAAASSSRNATMSPVAAEMPALRAPERPCGSVFSTSTTEPSGHAPRACSSSAAVVVHRHDHLMRRAGLRLHRRDGVPQRVPALVGVGRDHDRHGERRAPRAAACRRSRMSRRSRAWPWSLVVLRVQGEASRRAGLRSHIGARRNRARKTTASSCPAVPDRPAEGTAGNGRGRPSDGGCGCRRDAGLEVRDVEPRGAPQVLARHSRPVRRSPGPHRSRTSCRSPTSRPSTAGAPRARAGSRRRRPGAPRAALRRRRRAGRSACAT